MATYILHLSDLHLNNQSPDCTVLCEAVKCTLRKNDNLIICFTGDITSKSEEVSFKNFKILFNDIIQNIQGFIDNEITYFIVPGNHDVEIAGRKYSDIRKSFSSKNKNDINKLFLKDLNLSAKALNLCNDFGCFNNSKLIEVKTLLINNLTYNFIILNTSPFSSINHEDKDFHYFPDDMFWPSLTKNDKKQITFLLAHHRPDWFEETSCTKFKKFLNERVSVFIHGHDHYVDASSVSSINGGDILYISAGELLVDSTNNLTGQFNLIKVDESNEGKINFISYSYSSEYNKFFPNQKRDFSYVNKLELRRLLPSFEENFFKTNDYSIELDLRNTFVMPYLEPLSEDSEPILNFDELCDFLIKNKQIYICGQSGQGKTSIAKSIFYYFKSKKWCLYLDCSTLNANNMEASIKSAFYRQYGDNSELFAIFSSSPKNDKIVILDGVELLDTDTKIQNFETTCENMFGYAVVTGLSFDDNLVKERDYSIFNNYFAFRSLGLTIKQRESLIIKICRERGINDDFTSKKIVSTVFDSLVLSSSADLTSPLLLSLLTLAIIDEKAYIERQTSNSFSLVFEFNIQSALSRFGKKDDLPKYFLFLSEIAYGIFKRHSEIYFDSKFIVASLYKAKSEHSFINLDLHKTLDIFLKSNIIVKNGKDSYKFCKNSYLAYFAARKISILVKNGDQQDVNEIISNITYGINGDILLFLIYLLKELKIIELTANKLEMFLKDVKEIDFDIKNNNILKKKNDYLPETKEQAETRTQLIQRMDYAEKRKIRKIRDREEKVFANVDYNQLLDNVLKTSKLIEIVSKAVSGFDEEIDDSKRQKMLDIVLSSVLKIIFVVYDFDKDINNIAIKQFDDQKLLAINKLKKQGNKEDLIKKIENISYVDYMYSKITTFTLNFLTGVASVAGSATSLPCIDKIKNNKFCYLLFKLIAYERFGKFDRFCSVLDDFYKNKKTADLKIVNRVVRMYAITKGLSKEQINRIFNITKLPKEKLLKFNYSFVSFEKKDKKD